MMAGNGQLSGSGGTWISQGSSKPSKAPCGGHSHHGRLLATVRVRGWHTSVPGGEEQCLPHLRVPVQGWGKVAVPGLEGSQNTRVNNPDLGKKKGTGSLMTTNDQDFCLISLPKSNYAHFSWGAFILMQMG